MAKAARFEDLRIWQQARILANRVYDITRPLKDFEFRGQIRAAAVSAMNNTAEGFERRTDADFAHFLDVAKGSSAEVRSMLYLGEDRGYFAATDASALRDAYADLSKGIAELAKYLRRSTSNSKTKNQTK